VSPLELLLAVLAGLAASAGAAAYFGKAYSHPDLATRAEVAGLRALIESQHTSLLRELSLLQRSVARLSDSE